MGEELRPDIAEAASKMASKVGAKRELRKLPDHLWEGEIVERISSGTYGGGMGIIALTNQRLLFVKDGMMSKTTEDFPISKISSIQWSSGMLTGTITVFVSGNKAEIANADKVGGKEMVDVVRARIADLAESPAAAQQQPPAQLDVMGQLQKLGELHAAGILTDEEFATKKAELLSRL